MEDRDCREPWQPKKEQPPHEATTYAATLHSYHPSLIRLDPMLFPLASPTNTTPTN